MTQENTKGISFKNFVNENETCTKLSFLTVSLQHNNFVLQSHLFIGSMLPVLLNDGLRYPVSL